MGDRRASRGSRGPLRRRHGRGIAVQPARAADRSAVLRARPERSSARLDPDGEGSDPVDRAALLGQPHVEGIRLAHVRSRIAPGGAGPILKTNGAAAPRYSDRIQRSMLSAAVFNDSVSLRPFCNEWSPPSIHTIAAFAPILATTSARRSRRARVSLVPLTNSIGSFSA